MILTRPLKMTFPIARMNDSVLVRSIDTFINMIVASERGCCKADPDFGFAFEDFHYAAFSTERAEFFKTLATDTNNKTLASITDPMYDRTIVGSSKNTGNFAETLKAIIERYEKRLTDVCVTIDYMISDKVLYIEIDAVINDETRNPYNHRIYSQIW